MKSYTTVAKVLEINPLAAQVLYRYGVRSIFSPGIAGQTLKQLSVTYAFDLEGLLKDLNELTGEQSATSSRRKSFLRRT
jgi:hypothetical protein